MVFLAILKIFYTSGGPLQCELSPIHRQVRLQSTCPNGFFDI